jgi:hypothetical protein
MGGCMATGILFLFLSLSKLNHHQAWAWIVFLASQILLVYFMREVYRRCDC